ncbi:MAG: flagellar biosynthesis anti-sigma factor FlgM [Phycisphaerales bacterium JB059]
MTGVSPIDTQPASRVGRASGISRRAGDEGSPAGPARRGGVDRVEVSDAARYLAKLRDLPAVRQDLVDRVRGEIEAGVYESPEKIEKAIDELVEDLT